MSQHDQYPVKVAVFAVWRSRTCLCFVKLLKQRM